MAFNAGKPVEIKIYTGLTNFKPLMINPTKEELIKEGINLEREPSYTDTTEEGNKKVRLDFWGKAENLDKFDKISFFLEDTERVSKAGNYEFINEFGVSSWGDSPEQLKEKHTWFKGDKIRKAMSGESTLVLFIKRWLSISNKDVAEIDNIQALFNGNVAQLRDIIKDNADRSVQVLYTIRESEGNYYQNIYTRYFLGASSKNVKYWKNHFEKQQSEINYQNSFVFKEFDPTKIENEDDAPESAENVWGT